MAAKISLVAGFVIIACGYFIPPLAIIVASMHEFHFLGLVFAYLVITMLVIGELYPRQDTGTVQGTNAVDMTPWRHARLAGLVLIGIVITIYVLFADVSVLSR